MFLFLKKIRLQIKKILKKDESINKEIIIICDLSFIIDDSSFTGKNPPDDMSEKAKFKESKVLIEKIFKIIKITRVIKEYNKNIFIACLNTSELSNEKKLVNVFLKLSS